MHSSVEISRRVSVSLKTKPTPSPEPAGPTDYLPGSFLLHASFSALQLLHPLAVPGTCLAHVCLRAFTHVSPYAQNILCLHSRLFVSLHFSAMSPLWGGLPYLCPLSCFFLSHSRHHHLTFSSVQSLSHVRLLATPWTAARQASLSITKSWSFYIISVQLNKYLFTEQFVPTLNCRLWEVRDCVSCSLLDPQPLKQ